MWTLPLGRKDIKRIAKTGGILARRAQWGIRARNRVSKRYCVREDLCERRTVSRASFSLSGARPTNLRVGKTSVPINGKFQD